MKRCTTLWIKHANAFTCCYMRLMRDVNRKLCPFTNKSCLILFTASTVCLPSGTDDNLIHQVAEVERVAELLNIKQHAT